MTPLHFTKGALADIDRLTEFLLKTLPLEARRTGDLIAQALSVLRQHPEIGRPAGHGLRELVISRGQSGYLALYRYDSTANAIMVLAIRHQREARYRLN